MSENKKTLLTILFVCIVSSLLSGCGSVGETICWEKEGQKRNSLDLMIQGKQQSLQNNDLIVAAEESER